MTVIVIAYFHDYTWFTWLHDMIGTYIMVRNDAPGVYPNAP